MEARRPRTFAWDDGGRVCNGQPMIVAPARSALDHRAVPNRAALFGLAAPVDEAPRHGITGHAAPQEESADAAWPAIAKMPTGVRLTTRRHARRTGVR